MTIQFPYRIAVTRERPAHPERRRGHPIAQGAATLAGLGALMFAPVVAGASAALAASSGPVSVTINVAPPPVKSVTVSLSSFTYTPCSGGSSTSTALGFPNGICQSPNYTVTNGSAAAQIDVQGADALPAAGGPNWTLCSEGIPGSAPAPACNASGSPGPDQYNEHVGSAGPNSTELSNAAQCDSNFSTSQTTCTGAAPNASQAEHTTLTGPQSSINPASSFSTTITYTAV